MPTIRKTVKKSFQEYRDNDLKNSDKTILIIMQSKFQRTKDVF
jgi:hypothetical protein